MTGHTLLATLSAAILTAAVLPLLVFVPEAEVWLLAGLAIAAGGTIAAIQHKLPGLPVAAIGSALAGMAFGWAVGLYDLPEVLSGWLGDLRPAVLLGLAGAAVLIVPVNVFRLARGRWILMAFPATVLMIVVFAALASQPARPQPVVAAAVGVLTLAAWGIAWLWWGRRGEKARPPRPQRKRQPRQ
ncbi:MAG: hypothetical protein U0556_06905 [Dehalococcoidia bacterium]